MKKNTRKVCFVVMGFGKKADPESGRVLNLDATYNAIIKPAADSAGLRCIRADEVMHSGIIDTQMYEMLLRAELVIADISTGNVNAVYELGVRHALRPYSTIVMKEEQGKLYFDLNHISTFHYKHLGDDIGYSEAVRAKNDLEKLIKSVIGSAAPDSPVYTFLPKLRQPQLSDDQYAELLDQAERTEQLLATYLNSADEATRASDHKAAANALSKAIQIKPGDPYITQQLALATYKSKSPTELGALQEGLSIIKQLDPDNSNDPETTGIAGAIYKRLWLVTKDKSRLDEAIRFYGHTFEVSGDYYNGENYATCLDYRAEIQTDPTEALYDRMTARKVREALLPALQDIATSAYFLERADAKWVMASLANVSFGLGHIEESKNYEEEFLKMASAQWEVDTYKASKTALQQLLDF